MDKTDRTDSDNETLPELQWPVVIKLQHPVDYGEVHVESLTLRRGRLGDVQDLKFDGTPDANALMKIASRMAGQHIEVIKRLDMDDAGEVLRVAMIFFGTCLRSGQGQRR